MNEDLERIDERGLALKRIKARRDLQTHLVAYIIINAALWVIWAVTGAGYPWPAWVTGAWGVGLLLNAWDTLTRRPISEADIDREVSRLHPQH
jgi:2TM domain